MSGLGPPVCTKCMVVGNVDHIRKERPWRCPLCNDWDLKGSVFTYVKSMQDLIWKRTIFVDSLEDKRKKFQYSYIAKRPFMSQGNEEPNEHYRPWLEANIGKQGEDWNWDLCDNQIDTLNIYFPLKEHATLFELTWPK